MTATWPADRPHPTVLARPAGGSQEEELAVVRQPGPRQLLFTWPHSELVRNNDRNVLRGLLWCDQCKMPMSPSYTADDTRAYRCTPRCRRTPVVAGNLEAAIADIVKARVPEFHHLSPLVYASALEHLLARVVVGVDVTRLKLRWGADAPSPADGAG